MRFFVSYLIGWKKKLILINTLIAAYSNTIIGLHGRTWQYKQKLFNKIHHFMNIVIQTLLEQLKLLILQLRRILVKNNNLLLTLKCLFHCMSYHNAIPCHNITFMFHFMISLVLKLLLLFLYRHNHHTFASSY